MMATVREDLIATAVRDWTAGRDLETIDPPPLAELVERLAGQLLETEVVRVDNPPEQAEIDAAVKAVIRDEKIAAAIRKTKRRDCSGFPDPAEVQIAFGAPVQRWDICRVYRYVMGRK